MSFKTVSVTHNRIGSGTVQDWDSKSLTVWFQQYGARTFRFPDAFRTELKTDDPVFARYVAEALLAKE